MPNGTLRERGFIAFLPRPSGELGRSASRGFGFVDNHTCFQIIAGANNVAKAVYYLGFPQTPYGARRASQVAFGLFFLSDAKLIL